MTGTIFDVRRFSTHDGGGIRTTMFMKGCPLSCVWCHNPEGISVKPRPLHFPTKCMGCSICCGLAKQGGMTWDEGGVRLHPDRTEDWPALVDACPSGALAWDSRTVTVGQAAEELLKDRAFFKYGGGITLSGGEPLLQPEFAAAVLKRMQEEGVHTAMETSLCAGSEALRMVLPYLDLIYADVKIWDRERHRRYVGASNEQILDNLELLLTSEKRDRAVIRTPLIPEFTAYRENIAGIARLLSGLYPDAAWELLNYNPLAEAKYHLVDREFCFKENPGRYTAEEMEAFARTARENGVRNVIVEG